MFTVLYTRLLVFTYVYLSLPNLFVFAYVYHCLLLHVYQYVHPFTRVYLFLNLFTYFTPVYSSLPMFTRV